MIVDQQTFSDGSSLTQYLVRSGAPELKPGLRYRLIVNDANRTQVTTQILDGDSLVTEYTETARVSVVMAAVAAARYAVGELA